MCKKYEGLNWGDLPIGTRIIGHNYFAVVQSRNSVKYTNGLNGLTKIVNPHEKNWTVFLSEEITIPHGYQSPLWRVLNGEEI